MELRDTYGRRIDYVRVSITDRCNLRCIYCQPGSAERCQRDGSAISIDTVLRFLGACRMYGLRKVRLTGGEPLLRSDICEIVEKIKAIGVEDLSLTTNAVGLEKKAERLRSAGLDRVNISLDSLDHEKFGLITGGGSLDAVMRGIDAARGAGFRGIKINMVPVRGMNDTEIARFASMTMHEDIHVRFIELMNIGTPLWKDSERVTSDETLEILEGAYGKLEPCGDYGSSRNFRIKGARGVVGLISPMSRHFCDTCNRLRLKHDGLIRPCLFAGSELRISDGMSFEEIEDVLKQAVRSKPEGRGAVSAIPLDSMSQIGG